MVQGLTSAIYQGLIPTIYSDGYSILSSSCRCPKCEQRTPVELAYFKAPCLLDGRLHSPSSIRGFKATHPELFSRQTDDLDAMFYEHLVDTSTGHSSFYFKGKSLIPFEIKVYDPLFPKKLTFTSCQVCGRLLDVEQLLTSTDLLYNITEVTEVKTPVGMIAEYIYDIQLFTPVKS